MASESGSSATSGVGKVFSKTLERAGSLAPVAGGALRQMLEVAIDGVGPLPSAKTSAARHLLRKEGRVGEAIDSVVNTHIAFAGAQGFVTNLGGFATLPFMLPANLTGVAVVQTRMIAAICHLRGYNVMDNRVRTAIVMALLGGEEIGIRVGTGVLPTSPMAIATAPMFDADLDRRVAREVLLDLATRVGGKRLAVTVTKRLPLIGGGVGAVFDAYMTSQLGRFARDEFRARRSLG